MVVIDLQKWREKLVAEYSEEIQYFTEDLTEADLKWIDRIVESIMRAIMNDNLTGQEGIKHGIAMALKKGKKAGREMAAR